MKENCYSAYNKKSKNSAWKLKDGKQWKGRRKYKSEHQVKQVKVSGILYSINHCQKWIFFHRTFLVYGSVFVNQSSTTLNLTIQSYLYEASLQLITATTDYCPSARSKFYKEQVAITESKVHMCEQHIRWLCNNAMVVLIQSQTLHF